MPQKKRTASNPPVGLLKAVIEQSQSSVFAEAVQEWKPLNYYYASHYKACVCSPANVSNFTEIMNVKNGNRLEVCNSCAERHFGVKLSSELERVVRRIRANMHYTINDALLDYMHSRQIIDQHEQESYRIIRSKRDLSDFERAILARLNLRLLAYVSYKNKQALDYINYIVSWSISMENLNERALYALRRQLLEGKINPDVITKFSEISNFRYEPTYEQVIQAETMMTYEDTESKDVKLGLIERYGSYARIQGKLQTRQRRREELAVKKSQTVQDDEFEEDLDTSQTFCEDISNCNFYWNGTQWALD